MIIIFVTVNDRWLRAVQLLRFGDISSIKLFNMMICTMGSVYFLLMNTASLLISILLVLCTSIKFTCKATVYGLLVPVGLLHVFLFIAGPWICLHWLMRLRLCDQWAIIGDWVSVCKGRFDECWCDEIVFDFSSCDSSKIVFSICVSLFQVIDVHVMI